MTKAKDTPAGYLALTLHAHLPYVVNHGTWPHGIEWLHEAAAETYLPLLRVLANLERDGVPANFNINLSPILLEQLAHPLFIAEFPNYLTRKILAAREDEAYFIQSGDRHLTETARLWGRFSPPHSTISTRSAATSSQAFRHFNDRHDRDTHLRRDPRLHAAARHRRERPRAGPHRRLHPHPPSRQASPRHLGAGVRLPPRRILGVSRPARRFRGPHPGFDRIGVEQALSESSLDFFFVDTHLIEDSRRIPSPYDAPNSRLSRAPKAEPPNGPQRNLYQPYFVDGPYDKRFATTVFPRDPSTGLQVWSGDTGYPGDANYLDFHKKRFPGGHRYWQVTGAGVDIGDKLVYYPQQAADRAANTPATSSPSSTRLSPPASTAPSRPSSARPSTPSSSATGGSRVMHDVDASGEVKIWRMRRTCSSRGNSCHAAISSSVGVAEGMMASRMRAFGM